MSEFNSKHRARVNTHQVCIKTWLLLSVHAALCSREKHCFAAVKLRQSVFSSKQQCQSARSCEKALNICSDCSFWALNNLNATGCCFLYPLEILSVSWGCARNAKRNNLHLNEAYDCRGSCHRASVYLEIVTSLSGRKKERFSVWTWLHSVLLATRLWANFLMRRRTSSSGRLWSVKLLILQ